MLYIFEYTCKDKPNEKLWLSEIDGYSFSNGKAVGYCKRNYYWKENLYYKKGEYYYFKDIYEIPYLLIQEIK